MFTKICTLNFTLIYTLIFIQICQVSVRQRRAIRGGENAHICKNITSVRNWSWDQLGAGLGSAEDR